MPLTGYSVDEKQIALLRLEREQARNAINTEMLEELLTHLYGTPVGVVRTPQGDLFTRAAWRDVPRSDRTR